MEQIELYSIGEVAAILGVSAHTIRAWERRHGVVHPERTRARQRRYRHEDVERLRKVKRGVEIEGLSLRLAAQAATGAVEPAHLRMSAPVGARRPVVPKASSEAGLLQAIAQVLPQLVLIVDSEGQILEANVAVAKAFHTVRQKLVGRPFIELVDSFDRPKAELMYRPRIRTLRTWELNMLVEPAPRLYSFQCWPVYLQGQTLLALLGAEMFGEPGLGATPDRGHQGSRDLAGGPGHLMPTSSPPALQALVDQLPFGVIVVTVGPHPRVVYANSRSAVALGFDGRTLTARPFAELFPDEAAQRMLAEAVATRSVRTMRGSAGTTSTSSSGRPAKYWNLIFRPLFSSSEVVTSVLVVVEDATQDFATRQELESLAIDGRFESALDHRELAEVGLEHLGNLVPDVDFAAALGDPSQRASALPILAWTPGWSPLSSLRGRHALEDATTNAVLHRAESDFVYVERGRVSRLTAMPLTTGANNGGAQALGWLAWRRPVDQPLTDEQRHAVDAFAARLSLACELLHVRVEARRKSAQLDAVVTAGSVVSESRDVGRLGERFLERLAQSVGAGAASMGSVIGGQLVVRAAYLAGGEPISKPGDRYALKPGFISESVRTGEPTAMSPREWDEEAPRHFKKRLPGIKHAISIPLKLNRRVEAVVVLLRADVSPFTEDDVRLVQLVSSVALLALTLGRTNPPSVPH